MPASSLCRAHPGQTRHPVCKIAKCHGENTHKWQFCIPCNFISPDERWVRRIGGHNQVYYHTIKSHAVEMGVPEAWEISDCNLAPMEGYPPDKEGQL